ncbi:MAG: peptidoglycan DD-metalloendopeptidase family protein [Lachnospiraceae bacterium]|nr:peptidoglycan DD-metalloendopeptidase family protein [Lachnospiraceae bacterium]
MRVKKRIKRMVIAVTALSLFAGEPSRIVAETLTNELIENSEKEKESAEQSKNQLQSGLTNVKQLITSLEEQKNNLEGFIIELDADLAAINEKISRLDLEIEQKEKEIEQTTGELEEAKAVEAHQYEMMKKRIKHMYEKGNQGSVEILLKAASFTDFLNKADFISKISDYDRKLLEEYVAAKEEVARKKEELEEQNRELVGVKEDMANEQDAMQTLITHKEAEINTYEADINNKEAAVKEYEAEIAAQEQLIKDLEATILAEKKRLLEENKKAIVYDGGKFAWPAPGYTRISDDYGMRMHPTLGIEKFHSGIDLAAPNGSPILAAYDGEVVAAAYSSTMGNYVMIDHGDSLYTIYMHASSISVSKGQMVVRGEQIAKVGSTGRSTGPHLHFGVRENGNYVSPWKYLGE